MVVAGSVCCVVFWLLLLVFLCLGFFQQIKGDMKLSHTFLQLKVRTTGKYPLFSAMREISACPIDSSFSSCQI